MLRPCFPVLRQGVRKRQEREHPFSRLLVCYNVTDVCLLLFSYFRSLSPGGGGGSPTLSQTSYLSEIELHTVLSMENRLTINKVSVIEFTHISEFFQTLFWTKFFPVSRYC